MSFLNDFLGTIGSAYLGSESASAPYEIGRAGLGMATELGAKAGEMAAFKPYTVTSNLASVATTPEGGFTVALSPEQKAIQDALLTASGSFLSGLSTDPTAAAADIYGDIRDIQKVEEERERLALEERLLGQGRLGLSSAAYGGSSPELLAMETAREEAKLKAQLAAREMAMGETKSMFDLATGALAGGYMPEKAALDLLGASAVPAGFADVGRRTGAEIETKAGMAGIESLLEGTRLSEEAKNIYKQDLLRMLTGTPTISGGFEGGIFESLLDYLGGSSSSSAPYSAPYIDPSRYGDAPVMPEDESDNYGLFDF